jgi:hypothetical protein
MSTSFVIFNVKSLVPDTMASKAPRVFWVREASFVIHQRPVYVNGVTQGRAPS